MRVAAVPVSPGQGGAAGPLAAGGAGLRVAVVVATRDRPEMLARTLDALRAALGPDDEAVVVDSASRTDAPAAAAAAAGFPVVRCDRPGLSVARNAGVSATSAPVVAFTDDDCLVRRDWTDAIAEAFTDAHLGFVSGAVLPDRSDGPVLTTETSCRPLRFTAGEDPVGMGHGASMAFRRDALRDIGGFDEQLGAGGRLRAAEDTDAFWRVLRAGWAGAYVPGVVVTHRQWRSRAQVVRTNFGYGKGAGALAVKVIRLDGRPGWRMLRRRLWSDGLASAVRAARARYEQGVLDDVARAAGVVVGASVGAVLPLADGRFHHRPS